MRHVSLDDYLPAYADFLPSYETTKQNNVLLKEWNQTVTANAQCNQSTNIPMLNNHFGRCTWGDFVVLSYTWGAASETEQIILDGHPFQVTKNLHAALQQLWRHLGFNNSIGLWVDAICINQNDVDKRNLRLHRMRDIYAQAVRTVVWHVRFIQFLVRREMHLCRRLPS
jgi:hypothetical protein